MKKVYITRPIDSVAREILKAHFLLEENGEDRVLTRDQLTRVVQSFDGILSTIPDRLDREILSCARGLKVIANYAAGLDNIDLQAAKELGIQVYNVPNVTTQSTADLTIAIFLALVRRLPEAHAYVRAGQWKGWEPALFLGEELHGKTFGILGYGKIGQAVAKRAASFGMQVIVHSRTPKQSPYKSVSLQELYETSDYLSIHVPLTPQTQGMLNRKVFQTMKKHPVLINMARGSVIVTNDLVEALEKGWVRGAALDVTDPEPIAPTHPLCHLSNCLILPHIGSATIECRREMARQAALNLVNNLNDQ